MKPQLTIQELGIHGSDIKRTQARLLKGASWKKQRIVLIIPTGDSIPAKVALSHWNLIFPPNQAVIRILAQGMEVGEAYSNTIEQVIAHPELSQWEYILTIEHDNIPPQDGILKLISAMEEYPQYSVISGLYFTKGEGGVAQIWGDPNDPVMNFRPLVPTSEGLIECCGTGMGFVLWRMKMFKDERLRKPWFKTHVGLGGVSTQDLYAWTDFRKFGYRCAVDCSVKVGHYDVASDIVW